MDMLRLKQVCAKTGLSRSTIYAQIRQGVFPRAVRISVRSVAWRSADVAAWLESRPTTTGEAFGT